MLLTPAGSKRPAQARLPAHALHLAEEGAGVYRWCASAVVCKQQMHDTLEPSDESMIGHLCVSVWNSGKYRGIRKGTGLFRAGVANVLVAQEFNDSIDKETGVLEENGLHLCLS